MRPRIGLCLLALLPFAAVAAEPRERCFPAAGEVRAGRDRRAVDVGVRRQGVRTLASVRATTTRNTSSLG